MFILFGQKPKKSVEDNLVPDLKAFVVQIKDTTGVSYLAIVEPMLTYGAVFQAKDKGLAGLAQVINALSAMIEEEMQPFSSLGSSIMEIGIPEQPKQHYDMVIDKLGDFAGSYIQKGYSYEEVGDAMIRVARQIAKLLDKEGLLSIGLLRKELARRHDEYKRERFRKTASGERCTDESINILLRAETDGFKLSIENDGTFVLSKPDGTHYLRSNSDVTRFAGTLKSTADAPTANQSPVEKLNQQGQKHLREQKLEEAVSAFSSALRITPEDRDLYFQRGIAWSNSYYNRGKKSDDLQKAIQDYSKALQIDPEFAEGYFQRAGLLSNQGQVAAAIADYGSAIDRGHKMSSAYYCRGLLWQKTGEAGRQKAIADFDGAIRTGSREDQFMALMVRARAHHEFGDLELALDDLNAAAAYHPKGPPGLYEERGNILMKLGRTRQAIAEFGEGISAASPLASAAFVANMYELRGQCRMQVGETQMAREDYERAAQLNGQKR